MKAALAFVALAVCAALLERGSSRAADPQALTDEASPVVFVPGPMELVTLYASGQVIETEWETVWRPMCGAPPGLEQGDLIDLAAEAESTQAERDARFEFLTQGAADGPEGGALNLIFNLDPSVPVEADQAFADVEAYFESIFDDPITVRIDVEFLTLEPGVLGATGSDYTHTSWNNSREGLQDGADDMGGDNILNYLPSGSRLPVRYNANSTTVTQESRVYWTRANFRATVGGISGTAAIMIFNDDFDWDYDPSDGVAGYSLQDVLVHEVGHALGFTSAVDFRDNDVEAMDIFRFQRTSAGHDYNPDTTKEFRLRPRLVDFNRPNDQHICDIITHEYRMSDGSPYQASHFREQGAIIGLMDPALGFGQTFYPSFYSSSDLRMFDVIGYDR